ncbi:TonB family protein [Pseudoduganella sp. FT25W]|uniref:TonB family protein n=1 Tax=Duganella alba TaxID=2666081 RepID=A0A6L5QLA1_9BURK|nr:TonB family protein [Duganella alba]MRX10604.1 TonB family protein [Duganella alba]MRX15777.1 TonB family protein [Duganella alba]
MTSATLSLNDTYAADEQHGAAVNAAPVGPAALAASVSAGFATSYLDLGSKQHWLRRPGAVATVAIHGAALLAIWGWSSGVVRPPAPPPVIELIRIMPEPKQITPPKPEPVKEKPVALAPPKPAAPPQPAPKTVEASAAQAETYTPPAPPVHVAPPGPVTPAPPAPAQPAPQAAPAPKQISTEGIPTDYVNQVYARINRNADYPREAKMRRQQGKVSYRLTLNPDGSLVSFDIQSSGVEALDEAARDAIRRAAPFPRLPDLGGSSYLLAGNIVFKIN